MRLLGFVADDALARLYRGAAAFAYPSRLEGFGIPVVEALACGVPAVVSSHPSLDEASGSVALRADPNDTEAWTDALEEALDSAARHRRRACLAVHLASLWRGGAGGLRKRSATLSGVSLRVGIDVSPLALTRAGTARHIGSLLAALDGEDVDVRRYALGGSSRAFVPVRDLGWYLGVLPLLARRDGVDVLHCPTQRAPMRSSVPLVVTFHDLAVLRHPETFNRWTRQYSRRALPRVARAATRLIAVSEFTKRELLELLDVPEEKVRVIPNAVGEPFTADGEAAEGDYVLAVATLEPRKNLPRLVDGYRRARLNGLPLLVAGAAGWGGVRHRGRRRALARRGPRR